MAKDFEYASDTDDSNEESTDYSYSAWEREERWEAKDG